MLIDGKESARRLGFRATRYYELVRDGVVTEPIRRGRRWSRWPASEIEEIERALVRGASDAELRELARKLMAQRTLDVPALDLRTHGAAAS